MLSNFKSSQIAYTYSTQSENHRKSIRFWLCKTRYSFLFVFITQYSIDTGYPLELEVWKGSGKSVACQLAGSLWLSHVICPNSWSLYLSNRRYRDPFGTRRLLPKSLQDQWILEHFTSEAAILKSCRWQRLRDSPWQKPSDWVKYLFSSSSWWLCRGFLFTTSITNFLRHPAGRSLSGIQTCTACLWMNDKCYIVQTSTCIRNGIGPWLN